MALDETLRDFIECKTDAPRYLPGGARLGRSATVKNGFAQAISVTRLNNKLQDGELATFKRYALQAGYKLTSDQPTEIPDGPMNSWIGVRLAVVKMTPEKSDDGTKELPTQGSLFA